MLKEIGQELRKARNSNNISLEQAAKSTKLRKHYIQAIEEGDAESLPRGPYLANFLRTYANYLKLDLSKIATAPAAELNSKKPSVINLPELAEDSSYHPSTVSFVFSALLTIVIYTGWLQIYEKNQYNKGYNLLDYISQNESDTNLGKEEDPDEITLPYGSYLSNLKKDQPKIIILSKEDNWVKVLDRRNRILVEHFMNAGDIYFLPKEDSLTIKSTKPDAVEIFTENKGTDKANSIEYQNEDIIRMRK